jgi:putative YhbY family RNA-binding protein
MAKLELTPTERRALRADAHHLDPVVLIGNDGLTPAVEKEIALALSVHGLIKVRIFSDDRAGREAIYQDLADRLNAAPVQHIGKLLVLWRPPSEKTGERGHNDDEERMAGPREVKVLKYSKRAGHKPEVKVLKVLGNQRLTPGGNVRRAKPKKKTSIKKRQAD